MPTAYIVIGNPQLRVPGPPSRHMHNQIAYADFAGAAHLEVTEAAGHLPAGTPLCFHRQPVCRKLLPPLTLLLRRHHPHLVQSATTQLR